MINRQVGLLVVVMILISGCKQKENVNYSTFLIPDTLKKACFFKKGSYWIFKNDSTGEIDSTFINGDPTGGYTDGIYTNSIAEYITIPLQSSILYYLYLEGEPYDDPPRIGRLLTEPILYNPFFGCKVVPFSIYTDSVVSKEEYFSCQFGSGHSITYQWSTNYELQRFTGFTINGLILDKVILTRTKFDHHYPSDWDQDSLDFYYSPGNGFVKIIFRADTSYDISVVKRATISWSLLRYNVMQ